jgi:DNA-binding beta-propeller fold protein YncE
MTTLVESSTTQDSPAAPPTTTPPAADSTHPPPSIPSVRPVRRAGWFFIPALAVLLAVGGLGVAIAWQSGWFAAAPVASELASVPVGDEERGFPEAPDLKGGVDWLNSGGPISLADLRGKIVLLDFWTLCCINCIHTLPDLAELERIFAEFLVVIGVHTPKFDNEKSSESIRKAILRYEIKHPVVNDADMKIWDAYGADSWPTLVLIDAEGKARRIYSGEGNLPQLKRDIQALIDEGQRKKTIKPGKMRFDLAKFRDGGDTPLFFPGKVFADGPGNRLFIADSTHHRVVVTDLAGKMLAIIGTGEPGWADGPYAKARFDDPQGLTLHRQTLYVADRKNHLIRAIDLQNQQVRTIAGTGTQSRDNRFRGGPALKTGMNSPWDVLYHDEKLYIAMAGHHQIWTLDLATNELQPFAGNGRENIADGRLLPTTPFGRPCSEFAQPSGLTTDGKTLYVADSETSSIRAVPLSGKGSVSTLVGTGLFDYGDVDGVGQQVRLQHALGVNYHQGKLYVADTYNSKIKILDPQTKECKTWLGGRTADGWFTGNVFNEPAGMSIAGDTIYVADTNAHRIRVVDIPTRRVRTLPLQGVEPPSNRPVD